MQQYKARTTTPGIMPGSWLSFLLGAVSILIQREHQLGIARAGQYAVPIQGVFADDVGEAGSGLMARPWASAVIDRFGHDITTYACDQQSLCFLFSLSEANGTDRGHRPVV